MNREPYLAELAAKQPSQAKGDKSAGCMPAYNHSWFAAKCKRTVPELLVDQNSWPSLNCVRVTNGWFEYGATVAPVASISVACNYCTVCNLKGAVAAVLGLLLFHPSPSAAQPHITLPSLNRSSNTYQHVNTRGQVKRLV
jgi:hypothetical protein